MHDPIWLTQGPDNSADYLTEFPCSNHRCNEGRIACTQPGCDHGFDADGEPCPQCDGEGSHECEDCRGTGRDLEDDPLN